MSKFLDSNGVLYLWQKIKAAFVAKESGKGLSANDFTTAYKDKLDGIAAGANAYTLPEATTETLGGIKASGSNLNATGKQIVPIAKYSGDNLYYAYVPLAGANSGGSPNNNQYGMIKPGAGFVQSSVDIMGSSFPTPGEWNVATMGGATENTNGTFGAPPAPQAGDQNKFLSGDGTWKTAYTHPAYTARTGKPTANQTPGFGATFTVSQIKSDATGHVTAATDRTVTIPNTEATGSTAGLMSAADKNKLDAFGAASDYALKSDLTGLYKYKGSKATYSALPSTGNTLGDVWDVQADGMNYAWNGSAWDQLGGTFTIESITNAELDTICA